MQKRTHFTQSSQASITTFCDQLNLPCLIISKDWKIKYANLPILNMLEFQRGQLTGRFIHEVIKEEQSLKTRTFFGEAIWDTPEKLVLNSQLVTCIAASDEECPSLISTTVLVDDSYNLSLLCIFQKLPQNVFVKPRTAPKKKWPSPSSSGWPSHHLKKKAVPVASKDQEEKKVLEALRVLVAEDVEENQMVLKLYLEETPFEIVFVSNGAEALKRYQTERWDVIVMDMQMPIMDGFSATKTIRDWEAQQKKKPIPVIALTAFVSQEERRRCLDAGCSAYLGKPVQRDILIDTIDSLYRGQKPPSTEDLGVSEGSITWEIKLNPQFKELFPQLFESYRSKAQMLLNAVLEQDSHKIHTIGHQVKGSGGLYHLPPVSEIGAMFEELSKERNFKAARRQIDNFTRLIDEMEAHLENLKEA